MTWASWGLSSVLWNFCTTEVFYSSGKEREFLLHWSSKQLMFDCCNLQKISWDSKAAPDKLWLGEQTPEYSVLRFVKHFLLGRQETKGWCKCLLTALNSSPHQLIALIHKQVLSFRPGWHRTASESILVPLSMFSSLSLFHSLTPYIQTFLPPSLPIQSLTLSFILFCIPPTLASLLLSLFLPQSLSLTSCPPPLHPHSALTPTLCPSLPFFLPLFLSSFLLLSFSHPPRCVNVNLLKTWPLICWRQILHPLSSSETTSRQRKTSLYQTGKKANQCFLSQCLKLQGCCQGCSFCPWRKFDWELHRSMQSLSFVTLRMVLLEANVLSTTQQPLWKHLCSIQLGPAYSERGQLNWNHTRTTTTKQLEPQRRWFDDSFQMSCNSFISVDEAHCCDTSGSLRILIGRHSKATRVQTRTCEATLVQIRHVNTNTNWTCFSCLYLVILAGCVLSTEYSHLKEPNMRGRYRERERERRDQTSHYYISDSAILRCSAPPQQDRKSSGCF